MASIALIPTGPYNPYREAVYAFVWGVAPRLINILTSQPEGSSSRIDRIRQVIFGMKTQFLQFTQTNRLTKYTWFVLNDVIAANMGLASLVVLLGHFKEPLPGAREGLFVKLLFCIPIALYRQELYKEKKNWSRTPPPTEKAWISAKCDFSGVKNIIDEESAIDFRQIPCILSDREEFQKRTCAISNEPIRYPIVIRETPASPPIYYEHSNLMNWYSNKSKRELPPCWPESIPFTSELIVTDQAEMAQITEELAKVIGLPDVREQAIECLPELEEKLREEMLKEIGSLKVPDRIFSEFEKLIENVPIDRLIDMMWEIEDTLEAVRRERFDEMMREALGTSLNCQSVDYPKGVEDADPILNKLICAISHRAIRTPVTDITNGKTIYDLQSLKLWLIIRDNSPITRVALDKKEALANLGCIYDPVLNYRRYCIQQGKLQDENAFITHIKAITEEVLTADIHDLSERAREFLREGFIYICPISKKRVYDLVKVNQASPFKRDMYYERSAIQKNLSLAPLNWPKSVVFCQDNLIEMTEEQLLLEQIAVVKKDQKEWLEFLSMRNSLE